MAVVYIMLLVAATRVCIKQALGDFLPQENVVLREEVKNETTGADIVASAETSEVMHTEKAASSKTGNGGTTYHKLPNGRIVSASVEGADCRSDCHHVRDWDYYCRGAYCAGRRREHYSWYEDRCPECTRRRRGVKDDRNLQQCYGTQCAQPASFNEPQTNDTLTHVHDVQPQHEERSRAPFLRTQRGCCYTPYTCACPRATGNEYNFPECTRQDCNQALSLCNKHEDMLYYRCSCVCDD